MKNIAAIIVLLSISLSTLAANNVVGVLACGESYGVETCRDSSDNSVTVRFKGKSIQLFCEKSSSDPADYSIRIVAGIGDVTISSSSTYAYTRANGARTEYTRQPQFRDALRVFCDRGIIVGKLQSYITGNLYRDVESADQSRIGFFFSRLDSDY